MTGIEMREWASFGCPVPGCHSKRLSFWVGWNCPRFLTGFCAYHFAQAGRIS